MDSASTERGIRGHGNRVGISCVQAVDGRSDSFGGRQSVVGDDAGILGIQYRRRLRHSGFPLYRSVTGLHFWTADEVKDGLVRLVFRSCNTGVARQCLLCSRRLVWTFCIASQDGTQSSRCDKHVRTGSSCGPDRRRFRRDWIFVRAYHHSRSLAVGVRPRRRGVTVLGKI